MSKLLKYYGKNFKKGEHIFEDGDPAEYLYMIHNGKVEITKKSGNVDKQILVLDEGKFLGEMAVINSVPRSATATALEDCELISMDKEQFYKSVSENHKFAVSVIKFLSDRLRETTEAVPVLSEKNKIQQYSIDILSEFISNGKKDKSGEWLLIKSDVLNKKMNKKYPTDPEGFLTVIKKMNMLDKLKTKKDQDGADWLAYRLV